MSIAYIRIIHKIHPSQLRNTKQRGLKMTASETTICGKAIQHDNSGVGHNWRTVDASDIPANIVEEIAAEIIDCKQATCSDYTASNGQHYRW